VLELLRAAVKNVRSEKLASCSMISASKRRREISSSLKSELMNSFLLFPMIC
jgi:hypothetical protein